MIYWLDLNNSSTFHMCLYWIFFHCRSLLIEWNKRIKSVCVCVCEWSIKHTLYSSMTWTLYHWYQTCQLSINYWSISIIQPGKKRKQCVCVFDWKALMHPFIHSFNHSVCRYQISEFFIFLLLFFWCCFFPKYFFSI